MAIFRKECNLNEQRKRIESFDAVKAKWAEECLKGTNEPHIILESNEANHEITLEDKIDIIVNLYDNAKVLAEVKMLLDLEVERLEREQELLGDKFKYFNQLEHARGYRSGFNFKYVNETRDGSLDFKDIAIGGPLIMEFKSKKK